MKQTLSLALYLCVVVITGFAVFDLGAPEMIDGGGIVVASATQIAHMTVGAPDHCMRITETNTTWGLSVDPACSHLTRALAYADRAHLVGGYEVRALVYALFILGFTYSCLRATLKPTSDPLRAVGFYGWMWAPWPIMLGLLVDRAAVFRDIIPVWPTSGF